jgi:hypothetical protein
MMMMMMMMVMMMMMTGHIGLIPLQTSPGLLILRDS